MKAVKGYYFIVLIAVFLVGCGQEEDLFSRERTISDQFSMKENSKGATSFKAQTFSSGSRDKDNFYMDTNKPQNDELRSDIHYNSGDQKTMKYNPDVKYTVPYTEESFDGK
jgi:hypothetical protein